MLSLSGTTGYSDRNPSIVARSRLSRAPTMSSIAVTCESAHGSARPSTYWIAPALPRETSIRTLLSIKNGIGSCCAGLESSVEFAAKAIYVFDTVRHVLTIFPHAGEGRIANRARPPRGCFYGHVHFNNRALLDRYVLQWPEDAILVFCGDGHALGPSIHRRGPPSGSDAEVGRRSG